MEEFYIELGKQIKENRIKKGFSREALAGLLGVEQMTIYNWESSRSRIHGLELVKIAKLFKIKLNSLPK